MATMIESATSVESHSHTTFILFPLLPPEIRFQIWAAALTPRIVKWTRKNGMKIFTASTKSPPLAIVFEESRKAALFHGKYQNLYAASTPLYFSPLIDFLMFDPGWRDIVKYPGPLYTPPGLDPLESLPANLLGMRNIMVHPNYTDNRKVPSTSFEKLSGLEQLLVVADEKSIGFQSKFMLGTIYDISKYYHGRRREGVKLRAPYIAIGCLGWTGAERQKIHHGKEDDRKLVAISESGEEMKAHLYLLREEQWKFTQEQKCARRRLNLHLRGPVAIPTQQPSGSIRSAPDHREIPPAPPAYSELVPLGGGADSE
jgi:hypothetical protein